MTMMRHGWIGFITFARKPAGNVKVEDIVDERIVVELEKEGFIKRIYR